MSRAVMQQALDALDCLWGNEFGGMQSSKGDAPSIAEATEALRAALTQQGEPVAWMHTDGRVVTAATMATAQRDGGAMLSSLAGYVVALYAAPQPAPVAQPLTDEKTPTDAFENAIRRFGVVAACEWFGHEPDGEFTRETERVLAERTHKIGGAL